MQSFWLGIASLDLRGPLRWPRLRHGASALHPAGRGARMVPVADGMRMCARRCWTCSTGVRQLARIKAWPSAGSSGRLPAHAAIPPLPTRLLWAVLLRLHRDREVFAGRDRDSCHRSRSLCDFPVVKTVVSLRGEVRIINLLVTWPTSKRPAHPVSRVRRGPSRDRVGAKDRSARDGACWAERPLVSRT